MKPYTVSVESDLPRARVVELFDNVENLYKWQDGLQSVEPISGEPGPPGAVSKMVYLSGKNRIEIIETITKRELPRAFDGTYEWGHGSNTLENRFFEVSPNRTRWESTRAYELRAFMVKLMGFLFPGKFRQQNQNFLDAFKAFCEEGRDVRDA